MRVHTDLLTEFDIEQAARVAGTKLHNLTVHGSRSHERAFDFYLTEHRPGQRTASWDEHRIALAYLFGRDPDAHCGKGSYQNAEHFHWATGDRFRWLSRGQQHRRHAWSFNGDLSARGVYAVCLCPCGALTRALLCGLEWDMYREMSA